MDYAVNLSVNNPRLAGLPIIVTANATKSRPGVVFRRIILSVTVTNNYTAESDTFEFSKPVTANETIRFDISSAVRALADSYRYDAAIAGTLATYPSYSFVVDSYEEYMTDGQVSKASGMSLSQTGSVFMGTISDIARLYNVWPSRWSQKPTGSPQVAWVGHQLCMAGEATNSEHLVWTAPTVSVVTVGSGQHTDENYYGIPTPSDGYHLRFINSLGVHEDAFLHCLRTTEVNIKTDKYTIARQETLTEFSRGLAIKKNNHERWILSSGPLDYDWQQWYLHEVLMARWAWMLVDWRWVPCHILPEETVAGIDRQKSTALEVQFTIEFDINGSPFLP